MLRLGKVPKKLSPNAEMGTPMSGIPNDPVELMGIEPTASRVRSLGYIHDFSALCLE